MDLQSGGRGEELVEAASLLRWEEAVELGIWCGGVAHVWRPERKWPNALPNRDVRQTDRAKRKAHKKRN